LKKFQADNELIEKLRNGDVEAFDQVYQRYAGRLYAFSMKYLKSKEEAEELVQSVFLKVWENQKKLKKETSFKSYLFTIAYNEICNIFRRRKYQLNFLANLSFKSSEASGETEEQIDFVFKKEQVDQIIAQLPEKHRTVFLKSRKEGKSTKEISDELQLSKGTVDNYISESLKFIRTNLKDRHFSTLIFVSLFFA
jgi:RNA polymerase sigma-70 factor (ECF subfamily)